MKREMRNANVSDNSFLETVRSAVITTGSESLGSLMTHLGKKYVNTLLVRAGGLLSGVGTGLGVAVLITDLNSALYVDLLEKAYDNNVGLISCEFASAYQGYWFYYKTNNIYWLWKF